MGNSEGSGRLHTMTESSSLPFCEKTAVNQPKLKIDPSHPKGPRGQKRPFTFEQMVALNRILKERVNSEVNGLRDLLIFSIEIDSMLRAENGLALKVHQVVDSRGEVRERFEVRQCKTHGTVTCALTKVTQQRLRVWLNANDFSSDEFLFPGKKEGTHLSRRRLHDLVKTWSSMLGLASEYYSTHSLRRCKPVLAWNKNHDAEEVRNMLGHNSLSSVHHYIGDYKERALQVALGIDPWQ